MGNIVEEIHRFWFGVLKTPVDFPREKVAFWFMKNDAVDRHIRDAYLSILQDTSSGKFEEWKKTPRGYLCLILVLDQFPRHLYRSQCAAYDHDSLALELVAKGLELGIDQDLYPVERAFFYMPMQHSEDIKIQEKSVELYAALLDDAHEIMKGPFREFLKYAKMHLDVIKQFGRFPHRNAILNRPSTPEEEAFLKKSGSSF